MVLDVLFVSCEGRLGGAERSLLSLASQLRVYEQVAIACPEGSALAKAAQALGVEAIGLWLLPGACPGSFLQLPALRRPTASQVAARGVGRSLAAQPELGNKTIGWAGARGPAGD